MIVVVTLTGRGSILNYTAPVIQKGTTTASQHVGQGQTMHYSVEIPQNCHTYALFDPPTTRNLIIPVGGGHVAGVIIVAIVFLSKWFSYVLSSNFLATQRYRIYKQDLISSIRTIYLIPYLQNRNTINTFLQGPVIFFSRRSFRTETLFTDIEVTMIETSPTRVRTLDTGTTKITKLCIAFQ